MKHPKLINESRAKEIMSNYGLDAIITTMPENATYFTSYFGNPPYNYRGLKIYSVYTKDGDATLIIPVSELAYVSDENPWVDDIRTYGTFYYVRKGELDSSLTAENEYFSRLEKNKMGEDVINILKSVITEKKLQNAVIGWDTGNISAPAVLGVLEKEFPNAVFKDAFNIIREIRMIKTENELDIIRQAITINEKGLAKMFSSIREGITEQELLNIYIGTLGYEGAVFAFSSGGAGKRSGMLFGVSDYAMKKGDLYRFDAGCIYKHYWTDTGKTAVIGEPSEKQAKIYNTLRNASIEAEKLLKVGTKVSDLFDVMMESIWQNGIPEYQRHHLGHSIGIEFYEPPMIIPSDKTSDIFLSGTKEMLLEENMIINLEAPYYEPGFGGLQVENTFLITKDGYEQLTTYPSELYIAK